MNLSTTLQQHNHQPLAPQHSHTDPYMELVEQAIVDYTNAAKASHCTLKESFLISLGLAKQLIEELKTKQKIEEERKNYSKPSSWRSIGIAKRAQRSQSIFNKRLPNAEKIRDLRESLLKEQDKRSLLRQTTH